MSFGQKPQQVKIPNVASVYNPINNSTASNDFATGNSGFNGHNWYTNSSLAPSLQPIQGQATGMLNSNLGYLNQTPDQTFSQIQNGQNPYYNLLNEQTRRNTQSSMADAGLAAQSTGNDNSTAYGGAMGTILNNDIINRNQNAINAYEVGQQNATNNAGLGQNVLNQLYGYSTGQGQAANQDLSHALDQIDTGQFQNAQNQLSAQMANVEAQNAYNKQNAASLGSLISAGVGLAAAPFTMGSSLGGLGASSLLGSLAGGLGRIGGSMFQSAPLTAGAGMFQSGPSILGSGFGNFTPSLSFA